MSENLKTKAYRIIKDKIITCEYYPNMYSSEAFMQNDLQISRTPLRDALGRLEQEGFITIMPKRGMCVTDINADVINQLFEAKQLAEEYGIRTYGQIMDKSVLMDFQRRFDEEWNPDNIELYKKRNELHKLYDVDIEFHKFLSNSTDNKYIGRMLEDITNHDLRIRYFTGMIVEPRHYLSQGETKNIIEALLNRRIDDAVMYSKLHISTAKSSSLMAWINK